MRMDPVLSELDYLVRDAESGQPLIQVVEPLLKELRVSPTQPQAWRPVTGELFRTKFPEGVISAWVFVLREHALFPNERHPNSWQRSIALQGRAVFEIYDNGGWQSQPLDGKRRALTARGISIPPNTWHRIAIGPEPFVSLSFHTVRASELIEETCVGDDFSRTHRRLYQG